MIEPGLWTLLLPAAVLAVGIGWLAGRRGVAQLAQQVLLSQERQQALQDRCDELQDEKLQGQQKLEQQQTLLIKLTARLKDAEATLRSERLAAAEKLQLQQEAEQRLSQQFENLASRIFEQNSGNFRELNQNSLDLLLTPLKEQLEGFRRQVGETHAQETAQRHSLKFELERLAELNARMTEEAAALTRALKGDSKQQGNWGEVVLARILSECGLREGHEYHTQVNIEVDKGKRYQPDVIVHLPQDKDIIIDAKVSLTAYERWYNSDDELEKAVALKEHVASVRNHIRELGRKDYQQLPGVRTLDYVLMFVAVEPAFLTAVEADPSLVRFGLDNNILLVSPTNLMVALRTIENLWRYERQNQNARQIAERAGRLYEKLRLFVEEMQQLGGSLHRAQESYDKAMGRLVNGRGNLIAQVERFRELGVEVTKTLPEPLVNRALEREDPAE
ncbi:TPA: DNA recombination protein RmuC [Aeromonas hydrophila]|uniref:DNA recombination protein RmuC n=1 Tax=Aeromonas hydrophila TaxID=644 RepID=UPI000FD163C3|nr:DNA recombination protein RmuC [Aeromonas hydrophila]AZU46505.1 DNA recombination protein RmuC [Aeromonas hydrophila]MCV3294322.1 DNA recombination protein RmuC [Aeromonas hydrophila]QBX73453.1 DNA recombination protein RmuC [Aeromonas hydrophila]QBX78154.1 DNA recombination protein RmuC [Aeromonas hydrophila]WDA24267.1 DNA recombination protein RmuC [Aeromonas hydrophila]